MNKKLIILFFCMKVLYATVLENSDLAVLIENSIYNMDYKQSADISKIFLQKIDNVVAIEVFDEAHSNKIPIFTIYKKADEFNLTNFYKEKINIKHLKSKRVIGYINFYIDDIPYLTEKEKNYLLNKKYIKICIDSNWPPFENLENYQHLGLSREYLDLIKQKINIKFELLKSIHWSDSLELVKSGKCDILPSVIKTKSREHFLNFTKEYLTSSIVIATKNDIQFIENISVLNGKKLGSVKNYAYIEILKNKYPNLYLLEVENLKDGLEKVKNGELFGIIDAPSSIGYLIQRHFIGELKIAMKLEEKINLSIGVRKDDEILFSILTKTTNTIDTKPLQEKLNNTIPIRYENEFDKTIVWKMILTFIFILGIIFYWTLKLINEIKKRKLVENQLNLLNESLKNKIISEIEKNRQHEYIIFQQSKMAQMGEMLSMIAHQWRQPLTAISSATNTLSLKNKLGKYNREEYQEKLNNINIYSKHLSSTIDDFRNFFKKNKQKEKSSLEDIINDVLVIMNSIFESKNIEIITNFNAQKEFSTYPNELTQAVLNLIKNAADVLLENNIKKSKIIISTYKENNILILEVEDNGGGIDEAIADKIFDPYFTTKIKSDGTGLGLYMSKIIVEKHCNGEILFNNSDNGAVFQIRIKDE